MKQRIYTLGAIGVALLFVILAGSIQVGASHQVTVDPNLSVNPGIISFETVFPGDVHFKPIDIDLSSLFLASAIHDDVEYRIIQKPKPRIDSQVEREYCWAHPDDYSRCYPSLCPYLSKTADGDPQNDVSVPAFHDPDAPSSIATGRLAKSDNDIKDHWIIDLHVPCFRGQCDQRNTVPPEYQLDPELNGEVFGCDLIVEITEISYNQCIEEHIPVVGGDGMDLTPRHIDNYSDMGTCLFTTTDDVIVDGPVAFPTNCPNGAKIQAPAIKVLPTGSISYNKGDGILSLISTQKGITVGGGVTSIAKEPIKITSAAGILIEETTVRNSNTNGDIEITASGNILIASSTIAIGPLPPSATGGDQLKIVCTGGACKIEILDSILRTRTLDIIANDDIIMHGTWIDGRDPRGNYNIVSESGSIDATAGLCHRPNKITNGTEGNLTFTALAEDVMLDDIYIRVPENIKVFAGNIISIIRADISNDFAKPGDITMTAGGGVNDIRAQDAQLREDNSGAINFAKLNNGTNPATRGLFHVIGMLLVDQ